MDACRTSRYPMGQSTNDCGGRMNIFIIIISSGEYEYTWVHTCIYDIIIYMPLEWHGNTTIWSHTIVKYQCSLL